MKARLKLKLPTSTGSARQRRAEECRATARSRMDIPGTSKGDRVRRVIKTKGKPRP